MERVVPPEGATICGQFIKEGTIVGMNSWAVHRNRDLYGDDCDEWNPNRWLCESEKRRRMENALLTVSSNFSTQHINSCWSLLLLLLLACLQESMLTVALSLLRSSVPAIDHAWESIYHTWRFIRWYPPCSDILM